MADTRKQYETTALVYWTYSPEEWSNFLKWKIRRKGFFHYLLHRLFSKKQTTPPGISISEDRISVDDAHESFHDNDRRLSRVQIRDAGDLNVIEITYHWPFEKQKLPVEISVPVPRGKLREAIQVQAKLMSRD